MNCQQCRQEIEEHNLREAPGDEALSHIAKCASCRSFQEVQRTLKHLIGELEMVGAPADFDFRLRARLSAANSAAPVRFKRHRFAPGALSLSLAGCFALAVALSLHFQRNRTPPSSSARASMNIARSDETSRPAIGNDETSGSVRETQRSNSRRVMIGVIKSATLSRHPTLASRRADKTPEVKRSASLNIYSEQFGVGVAPAVLAKRASDSQSLALETARTEARAAEEEWREAQQKALAAQDVMRLAQIDLQRTLEELRRVEMRAANANANVSERLRDELQTSQSQVKDAQARLLKAQADIKDANDKTARAQRRLVEAQARVAAISSARMGSPVWSLRSFGVEAVALPSSPARQTGAGHGLLVIDVQSASAAARSGLRVGDVIESVNGRAISDEGRPLESPASDDTKFTLVVAREGKRLTLELARTAPPK